MIRFGSVIKFIGHYEITPDEIFILYLEIFSVLCFTLFVQPVLFLRTLKREVVTASL